MCQGVAAPGAQHKFDEPGELELALGDHWSSDAAPLPVETEVESEADWSSASSASRPCGRSSDWDRIDFSGRHRHEHAERNGA
jgi:hypothetical protein